MVGPNGSGKSSMVTSTDLVKKYDERIINPDNYAKGLPDIEDRTERYMFALKQCELLRNNLLDHGLSFGFETVGSTQEKIDILKKASAKGYVIEILFVTTESPELCSMRVQKRAERGGHDVERSKIFSRYARTMGLLKDYVNVADVMAAFDNSGSSPRLVFTKNGTKMNVLKEPSGVPWVEEYILPHFRNADKILK